MTCQRFIAKKVANKFLATFPESDWYCICQVLNFFYTSDSWPQLSLSVPVYSTWGPIWQGLVEEGTDVGMILGYLKATVAFPNRTQAIAH